MSILQNWRVNGIYKNSLLVFIVSLFLIGSPVSCYGQGRWRYLRSTSTQKPEEELAPPQPETRYQFPSAVTQPPSSQPVVEPPSSLNYGNRPGPPLRGRPTSRYNPSPPQNSWGWGSSSPQVSQPSLPSLNSTLNPYRHQVYLDLQNRFELIWVVDWSQNRIIFNVTVKTTGWVGLGLAPRVSGKMTGADLIIGGVYPNGSSYFSDRYAIGNQLPLVDPNQDCVLHDFHEKDGLTFLSFSRALDTCDPEHDIPITDDSLRILWAFGETDELISHYGNRGIYDAYMLSPDLTPTGILNEIGKNPEQDSLKLFNMTVSLIMPQREMTYWCTWYKAPTTSKHHIIGYDAVFPSDQDRAPVHHLSVSRCTPPPGISPDLLFGSPSLAEGGECYFDDVTNPHPMDYCRDATHLWGVGGPPIFLPDHLGIPMSEDGVEYFMLQVHYDNPDRIQGRNVTFTLRTFYTPELRQFDAGVLNLGQQVPAAMSIVIPPWSVKHASVGVCPSSCIEQGLKGQEVNIVAGMLHTHTTGVGARLMHFRGDKELPWITNDDNWNYNFQQFRVFNQERRLKPGDVVVQRCEYDTTRRNGSAAVGGFAGNEAMCTSNLYYYPRQKGFSLCRSLARDTKYWELLQVRNATWDTVKRKVVISDPPRFAGLTMLEHANQNIKWDGAFRKELQFQQLFAPQVTQCSDTIWAPQVGLNEIEESVENGVFPPLPAQPNGEHPAQNPRNVQKYKKPLQCHSKQDNRKRETNFGSNRPREE